MKRIVDIRMYHGDEEGTSQSIAGLLVVGELSGNDVQTIIESEYEMYKKVNGRSAMAGVRCFQDYLLKYHSATFEQLDEPLPVQIVLI